MNQHPILKGSLIPIILKLLESGEAMYGYEITQKVKELTSGQMQITEGALYPTLHKLESEGLLSTYAEIVDGRARKYYKLTEAGTKEKDIRMHELHEALLQVQRILFPQLKWADHG